MVEVMGIEPMSESVSSGLSPSAASDLLIRLGARPEAGWRLSYPVGPLYGRDHAQGFPACLTPDPEPAGEFRSMRGAELSSKCEFVCIFSVCI